ncbi:MAG: small basic protein [Planctomycetia bacterium]
MTMHKSLKTRGTTAGTRSVLTRWERLEKLSAAGRWHEGDKVTGLPKVRTKFKVRRKAAPAAAAAGTPAAGAAAAAPAAGAKAAAAAPAKAAAAPAAAAKPAKK